MLRTSPPSPIAISALSFFLFTNRERTKMVYRLCPLPTYLLQTGNGTKMEPSPQPNNPTTQSNHTAISTYPHYYWKWIHDIVQFCETDVSLLIIDYFDKCLNDIGVCRMLIQTVMLENMGNVNVSGACDCLAIGNKQVSYTWRFGNVYLIAT